jgi:hypothetical protein
LTHTHIDISFVVGLVSWNMQTLHEIHWKKKQMILQYIWGPIQFEIYYSLGGTPLLVGFIDLDWASNPNDWKFTTCYIFSLGSRLVTWACKKQHTKYITNVEYQATINANQESSWLQHILSEFGFHQQHPTTLWYDN